jgi:hypothetical protein
MVAAYSSKVTWPLQSLKLDDQLAFAKVRASRRWKELPDTSSTLRSSMLWRAQRAQHAAVWAA